MRAEAKVRSLLTRSTHDRERLVSAPLARCRASREGLLAELIPGAQLRPQERVLMPLSDLARRQPNGSVGWESRHS